jgi:hypothetical protein
LGDLRRAQPADTALRNLLRILSTKLELSSHLPVYEYEAHLEGNEQFAAAFHRLAEDERRIFEELLSTLRIHLNDLAQNMNVEEGVSSAVTTEGSLL